ncbi:MAG: alginate lyase family protein [Eubacteriales bacterium]|nr:alginate lyase family protein [Eubacteriales bacterium]
MRKKSLLLALVYLFVTCLNCFPVMVSAEATVEVKADNDWDGNKSWQSATMTATGTQGLYIVTNTDAGYSFAWEPSTGTITASDKVYTDKVVVPSMIDGVAVKTVGGDTFRKPISTGKYVVVSEGITSLATNSFRDNGVVVGVRLPKSLTSIGALSFLCTYKLTDINLGETSVTTTGATVFKQSTGLKEITLPKTLSIINSETFYECSSLENITFLGDLVECKTSNAFSGTNNLRNITFRGNNAPTSNVVLTSAGMDYNVSVHYPQGGVGYTSQEFISAFREGTRFIEMPTAISYANGKPNLGEKITSYIEYANTDIMESDALCVWQRSTTPTFDSYENAVEPFTMRSNSTSEYTITDKDKGKYIRFFAQLPNEAGEIDGSRHCTSNAIGPIDSFTVDLQVVGPVVGDMFYTVDGIGQYNGKVKAYNSTATEQHFTLVAAWFNNDKSLSQIKSEPFTVPVGSETLLGYYEDDYIGSTLINDDLENNYLKIFVIKDKFAISPLANSITILGIYDAIKAVEMSAPSGMYTKEQISFVRDNVRQGKEPWTSAYDMLIEDADNWLNEEPTPSNHWYVPGYYTNESGHIAARAVLMADLKSAYACGLAYQLTGNRKYADQTVRVLNAWSRTLSTMGSEDSGLVFAYVGNGFPLSAELVKDYDGWRAEDKGLFDSWMNNVYLAFASKVGGSGNSGDWGVFARCAGKAYLGKSLDSEITELERLITDYIDPATGSLPKENERGSNGMWYTYFALAPMTAACQIIYNTTGDNYFTWKSPKNTSVKQALDTFFYYCNNKSEWPYSSSVGYPSTLESNSWPLPLWEAMGGIYNEQRYTDYVKTYRPLYGPFNSNVYHHITWFYPTLMYKSLQIK